MRVINKNLKPLLGHPLLYYTIVEAKKAKSLNRLVVNTDGDEIAEYAQSLGVEVYRRPPELGADIDTSQVFQEQVYKYEREQKYKPEWIVALQPTSPMRLADDIDKCVELAQKTKADTVLTVTECKQHPFWVLEIAQDGKLYNCMQFDMCGSLLVSQNLPAMLYPTGAVYVTRREWIMAGRIYGHHIRGVTVPYDRSIDLETETDFIIAETLMKSMRYQEPERRVYERIVGIFE